MTKQDWLKMFLEALESNFRGTRHPYGADTDTFNAWVEAIEDMESIGYERYDSPCGLYYWFE